MVAATGLPNRLPQNMKRPITYFFFLAIRGIEHLRCRMKSVERNLDFLSLRIALMICLLASFCFAATRVRIANTLKASDTDSVPSAESFRPVNGKESGPRWHWQFTFTRHTRKTKGRTSFALALLQKVTEWTGIFDDKLAYSQNNAGRFEHGTNLVTLFKFKTFGTLVGYNGVDCIPT